MTGGWCSWYRQKIDRDRPPEEDEPRRRARNQQEFEPLKYVCLLCGHKRHAALSRGTPSSFGDKLPMP